MTTRRKRTENGEEWTFSLNKKSTTVVIVGVLFMMSGNPMIQKAGSTLLGIASPVSNIEEIKAATSANTKQIEAISGKVDTLIVEFEHLRMQKDRTAER